MSKKCSMRSCDCYHEGEWGCSHCTRAEDPEKGELTDKYISIKDQVIKLYDYLSEGKVPEGVHVWRPKMSRKHAFSVIWFLQEIIHCLPDHIEQCDDCLELFDTDREGYYLDDQYKLGNRTLPKKYWGSWCDNCVPNVDFVLE